jgi:GNAT superfamily N-acetyltransferase
MRWHPDSVARVLTVPYVPTLGPVHPAALSPALLDEVTAVAGTGQFLPHDPGQRWSTRKDEHLLTDQVRQHPEHVTVATLRRRAGGMVTVYHYRPAPPDLPAAIEAAATLRVEHRAAAGRVVWFALGSAAEAVDAASGLRTTRVLLKVFDHLDAIAPGPVLGPVVDLATCAPRVRASFTPFATAMTGEGFGFLHTRWQAGTLDGPILVAVADQRVVGAIGPLRLLADPIGGQRLLPQYLAVLPTHRRQGYGRALWRAAACWGQANGAAYQLLQAAVGGASDRLFLREGLTSLGLVCQATT